MAARRLLARIVKDYARLLDVISADALYLEAGSAVSEGRFGGGKAFRGGGGAQAGDSRAVSGRPEPAGAAGAAGACMQRTARQDQSHLGHAGTDELYDTTLGHAVRVVWAEERTTFTRIVGGTPQQVTQESTWVWVTDLSCSEASALTIQRMGHDRWDVENRGFNELVQHWQMDHAFVHDPTAIEVLLLTLAVAFLTTYLFYAHNLKEPARRFLSRLALAARLLQDLPRTAGELPGPSG